LKNRKEKEKEYLEKYSDIPKEYEDRLKWMVDHYNLSEKMMQEIVDRRTNMIDNISFFDFIVILYMEPEGTPRHRYRLITPKNYASAAFLHHMCTYINLEHMKIIHIFISWYLLKSYNYNSLFKLHLLVILMHILRCLLVIVNLISL
jgi:hypothetical protein